MYRLLFTLLILTTPLNAQLMEPYIGFEFMETRSPIKFCGQLRNISDKWIRVTPYACVSYNGEVISEFPGSVGYNYSDATCAVTEYRLHFPPDDVFFFMAGVPEPVGDSVDVYVRFQVFAYGKEGQCDSQ